MPELDPYALVTASQLAELCHVSVSAVCNWRTRGYDNPVTGEHEYLKPARNENGTVKKDSRGCILYCYLDGAIAENATRKAARRAA